jgi:hypothetical protein
VIEILIDDDRPAQGGYARDPAFETYRAAVVAAVREAIPELEADRRLDEVIRRLFEVTPPRNRSPRCAVGDQDGDN